MKTLLAQVGGRVRALISYELIRKEDGGPRLASDIPATRDISSARSGAA